MAMTQHDVLVGVFDNRTQAQQAVSELKRSGFTDEQVGVASRDNDSSTTGDAADTGSFAEEGAVTGLAAGAGIGALWGLGILAGAIPGIGPAIAGGTLGILLSSAAAGAAAAGIGGALIGLGIPEDEAEHYDSEFKAGRTIVTVKGSGRHSDATTILRRFGGHDIQSRGAAATSTMASPPAMGSRTSAAQAAPLAAASTAASGEAFPTHAGGMGQSVEGGQTMKLHEEKLQVHKDMVETGEVTLRKEVHTEHKTIEVPVMKEEIVIERRAASGTDTSGTLGNETIRVPVREEQVHVEKQPVVTEEISVGKRKVQGTERVDSTIRKEDVRIDKQGDVDLDRK